MSGDLALALVLSEEQLQAIAERVAVILAAREARPGPSFPELLTPDDAAALLSCRRKRIYELCHQGRLERVKDGGRLLIRREEIERYLAENTRRTA